MILDYLKQEILDENIPRDLLAAYRSAQAAQKGVVGNPDSKHDELNKPGRRSVTYDYGKSNYEEITPEEAMNYLTIVQKPDGSYKYSNKDTFNNNLQNLRFMINDRVMEWGINDKGQMYYTYWTYIPREKMDAEGLELKDGTTDSKWVKTVTQLAHVIRLCDKIYKTDEYQHEISLDDKVARTDKKKASIYRSMPDKASREYDPHHLGKSFGKNELDDNGQVKKYNSILVPNIIDTGAHLNKDIYLDLDSTDRNNNYAGNYLAVLKGANFERKQALDKLNLYKKSLENLEKNRDEYDQDFYEQKHQTWSELIPQLEDNYKKACTKYNDLKSKIIMNISSTAVEARKELLKSYQRIEEVQNDIYRLSSNLSSAKAETRNIDMKRLYDLSIQLKKLQDELKDSKENIEDNINDINSNIDNTKLADTESQLYNYINDMEHNINSYILSNIRSIRDYEKRIDELNNEYKRLTDKSGKYFAQKELNQKNIEAKWDSRLDNILDPVDSFTA